VKEQLRLRYWIAVVAAAVGSLLAVATIACPNWIEMAVGIDPDHGSGALESLIVGVCVTTTASCLILARYERRRARHLVGLT
jgi:hypothetical protein